MHEERVKILLVEDNPADARLIHEFLSDENGAAFGLVCVNRLSTAVEALATGGIDVILLDLSLPDCQGLETFYKMRALAPDLPIVVETGLDDEDAAIKAVQEGAQDFLVKGHVDSRTLRSAIRHAIERKEMQDRLLASERQAAVAQMMTGLAHDFETLLAGIIGYAELTGQRNDIPAAALGYIEAIGRQGRQATDLLHKLMDFSQRATGSKQPISLLHGIEDIVTSLRCSPEESIEVAVECESEEASEYVVSADPLQIQRALTNLAHNATDAMPTGGELRFALSRVRINADEKAPLPMMPPGDWVRVEVSDTGTGIENSDLPRIFDPYFATEEMGEASGLDLAQVYGIVRNHGGFIDVSSRVGEGTTFTIFLPALLRSQEAPGEEPVVSHQNRMQPLRLWSPGQNEPVNP